MESFGTNKWTSLAPVLSSVIGFEAELVDVEPTMTDVVFKVGVSAEGRKAAMTHTGALAGSAEVFDAVAGDLGVIRVDSLDDAIEALELIVHAGVPISRKVGLPDGSGTISMSRQNTPLRKPVPSALEHASLAANICA